MSRRDLKLFAVISMLFDHIAWLFISTTPPLGIIIHFFGRTSFPIFAFFIAEGYYKTKDLKKYFLRLILLTIVSAYPFYLAFNHLYITSVMLTLLLGLTAIHVYNKEKLIEVKFIYLFFLVILGTFSDWGLLGVSLILLLGIFHNKKMAQTSILFLFATYHVLNNLFISNLVNEFSYVIMYLGLYLGTFLIFLYNGENKEPKLLSKFIYWFYPLHLLILGLINKFI